MLGLKPTPYFDPLPNLKALGINKGNTVVKFKAIRPVTAKFNCIKFNLQYKSVCDIYLLPYAYPEVIIFY